MRGTNLRLSCLVLVVVTAVGCHTTDPLPGTAAAKAPVSVRQTSSPVARSQSPQKGNEPNVLRKLPAGDEAEQEVAVRIAAMVNGKPIFDQEVETAAYQFLQSTFQMPDPERTRKQKEIRQKVLKELIRLEVVLQEAFARLKKAPKALQDLEKSAGKDFEKRFVQGMIKGNGLTERKQLEEFLLQRGLAMGIMKRQWIRRIISQEFLRSLALRFVQKISRQELQDYYESHPKEFEVQDSAEWQDIFVSVQRHGSREKAKAVADALVQRLRAGGEQLPLCKKFDDGDSALREGKGIGTARGEIQPQEVEDLVFSLKDGEVAPPVELDTGFHVVRLVKRQQAGRKPFNDEVQNFIRNKLRSQIVSREMKRIIKRLESRSVIQIAEK